MFVIHNLHFRGAFEPGVLPALGLPWHMYQVHGLECYGSVSFLKAGLYYADRIVTVSPRYAWEIQTALGGEGLDGLLRSRSQELHGITNGIDTDEWNPASDPRLVAPFDSESLRLKAVNKAALQRELGLRVDPGAPLVGVVSRLSWQKGLDLVAQNLPWLAARGGQAAVLGSGERPLERDFTAASHRNPLAVSFTCGYNEDLSHRVVASCDFLVVPSRFEPCGLTQLYAMRYGTIPIVRRTGGLADTVLDVDASSGGTGIVFDEPRTSALTSALERACELYTSAQLDVVRRRGMAADHSWSRSARAYSDLLQRLVGQDSAA